MTEISRRTFLGWLAKAGVAATLPLPIGATEKIQEVAAAEGFGPVTLDEINAAVVKHIMPGVVDYMFKQSPVFTLLKKNRRKDPGFPHIWGGDAD